MIEKIDIINRVKEIVSRYEATDIGNEDKLEDINVTDLSKVQIAMEIERVFGVEFNLGDLTKLQTVKDLVVFIEKNS